MTHSLSDQFDRALAALCSDEQVRATEAGADGAELWTRIDALGFTDALIPEALGGAGLVLADVAALLIAAGRAGLSHPFGETMLARALLVPAGWDSDGACIALAQGELASDEAIVCRNVSGGLLAAYVLVEWRQEWLLMPRALAQAEAGSFRPQASASLRWASAQQAVFRCARGAEGAEALCSAIHAAHMAGAMDRILDLSIQYANDRRQFGKAIGQFQAIQQDLAVLAEQARSATTAALMGCASSTPQPQPWLAAVAKLRACEASAKVAALAHAVHGAIGVTEEHMLGLFTTRLHEWRAAPGNEHRCAQLLGQAVLAEDGLSLSQFVGAHLSATAVSTAANVY